jgi:hypothetical protein
MEQSTSRITKHALTDGVAPFQVLSSSLLVGQFRKGEAKVLGGEKVLGWFWFFLVRKSDCFLLLLENGGWSVGKRNHLIGFDVFMQPHVLARLRRLSV